jgi:hypothetical protein
VGRLPARVYWRRRLLVLLVLVALLAGGGWLVVRLLDPPGQGSTGAGAAISSSPVPTPAALEQVLPSLASLRTPSTAPATPSSTTPTRTGPAPGGPCTDEMVELTVRAPATVPAGSSARLQVVIRNVSEVACVRRLDAELLDVELFDAAGDRVWGSKDCRLQQSDRSRTLAPGEGAALDVVWSGLPSSKRCAGERTAPAAGVYALRARLGTTTAPERRIRLT